MEDKWQLFVDTGGTFTDCIGISPNQSTKRIKVLSSSTLRAPIIGVKQNKIAIHNPWKVAPTIFKGYSVRLLGSENWVKIVQVEGDQFQLEKPLPLKKGDALELTAFEEVPLLAARMLTSTPLDTPFPPLYLKLGSTRGTNALLEKKGAKVFLLTTAGFKDLPKIRDQRRAQLFSLNVAQRDSLAHTTCEVKERIHYNGAIETKLKKEDLDDIYKAYQTSECQSVAIALVNAHKNNAHEEEILNYLQKRGVQYVSTSTQLSNSIGYLMRLETTLVNAYLKPVIDAYTSNIKAGLGQHPFKIMTSFGGLIDYEHFEPKDCLLSGPAGGIVGAGLKAEESGTNKILTLDMGGTSADVALYHETLDYRYLQKVGDAAIEAPCLAIETIAAGGGSICSFDGKKFQVGPESAGANPGPACYGAGGPLTLTDVNLLLGKMQARAFGIPIHIEDAEEKAKEITEFINKSTGETFNIQDVLKSFELIANEKMAEAVGNMAINKGHDCKEHALLSFGGAGGMHVCSIAEILGITSVLTPFEAGLLSAYGIGHAQVERMVSQQLLTTIDNSKDIEGLIQDLFESAQSRLIEEGYQPKDLHNKQCLVYLRFVGQDHTIEVNYEQGMDLAAAFKKKYLHLFAHWIEGKAIEIESIKATAATKHKGGENTTQKPQKYTPTTSMEVFNQVYQQNIPTFCWEELHRGATMVGPAILYSNNATLMVNDGWNCTINEHNTALLHNNISSSAQQTPTIESAQLELYINRLNAIANDMGSMLQRASFSVNIKERLDFSCAILDKKGQLIVNAPHIPVHLGSMGICVRRVAEHLTMEEGDVVITNHPAFGGSHLPDVTLISPFYYQGKLEGYLANRAHHAEIGGSRPGSMPPNAQWLTEEGVIIAPYKLLSKGKANWDAIESMLSNGLYPSRSVQENIADLKGALASINLGQRQMHTLFEKHSASEVQRYMLKIKQYAANLLAKKLQSFNKQHFYAKERLDEGQPIVVAIELQKGRLSINFSGSGGVNNNNMNATEAIVHSATLYVLRLLVDENIPLNEGLLEHVKIHLPHGFLNPNFGALKSKSPAVVGGNTEVSQRLTDTLIKAFELAACSQGTMNNVVFGNDNFGYYETIGGGVGAGDGFHGASAVHQHMTNTKITDPEIIELRYPVAIKEFSIRKNSAGNGKWHGGEGLKRVFSFREKVKVSVITQHRKEQPFGLKGGLPGKTGQQYVQKADGTYIPLKGIDGIEVDSQDLLIIESPGGGGYLPPGK